MYKLCLVKTRDRPHTRELYFAGELRVEHVPTADNVADIFTKPLPFESFARHKARLLNTPLQA